MNVRGSGADCLAIRFAKAEEPLHDFLIDEITGDLRIELFVEPSDKSAHLGPDRGASPNQGRFRMCLVEVLDDGVCISKYQTIVFDEDGQVARGVERQKIFASFPQLFDMHVELEILLG